eukprot:5488756-Alexandrium_andersonii.AAC.1
MVAGHRGRASGSRVLTCCASQRASRRLASVAPSAPRSCNASVAACRLAAVGSAEAESGAVRLVKRSRIHVR